MSGNLRPVGSNTVKPVELSSTPTVAKSTLHQGFTYTILIGGQVNSNALVNIMNEYVKTHLPSFDAGLKKLSACSTALALRNTKYEQATGAGILKDVLADLAKYRKTQIVLHTNFQGLAIFAREVAVYVRCLKPSHESIYMRSKPSNEEEILVEQAIQLDQSKDSSYRIAKKGVLVDVNSVRTNMFGKLKEFDAQVHRLETRASNLEASQYSMMSFGYWWTSPVKVPQTGIDELQAEDIDVSDDEDSSSKSPTPPSSSSSASSSTSSSSSMVTETSATASSSSSISSLNSSTIPVSEDDGEIFDVFSGTSTEESVEEEVDKIKKNSSPPQHKSISAPNKDLIKRKVKKPLEAITKEPPKKQTNL